MKKRIEDLTVIGNRQLADGFFVIKAAAPESLPVIMPGQFAQALVTESPATFLRRPLSFHDVDYSENSVSLLIQIVGPGTGRLSRLQNGQKLNLIYPLGNSFTLPGRGERVLLTGGGCGMAPLLYLGRRIREAGADVHFALGFRDSRRMLGYADFEPIGKVYIATEDGSAGYKGLVTDLPPFRNEKWDRIYSCGPEPMMKAVATECMRREIFCEVSLENLMACGMGICLCCIVPTAKGNLCSCTDGPVFNVLELRWQTSASK